MSREMESYIKKIVKKAKEASFKLSTISSPAKNKALHKMAKYILENKNFILEENKKDIEKSKKNRLSESFIDRLTLNEKRLHQMSVSLREIASLCDPINRLIKKWKRPNGLIIQKVRVPIGVVLIVYEARPNVTSDCVGLLFKSSNVGILRGGSEAIHSNRAIAKVLKKAIYASGISFDPFFVIEKTDRRIIDGLLKQDEYIDLVIPRGGEALIRKVVESSCIAVIKHYKGVCHIFVDREIDLEKALKICVNAKVQRPHVCNAVETILVHQAIANKFLPQLKKEFDKYAVQIRADAKTRKILKKVNPALYKSGVKKAEEEDWFREYLDLIVSIKVVKDIDEAISHINFYGSHHTDSIITKIAGNAQKFTKEVDSACCFVNISTRFSDGYEFGLGAEIGISTDKLHARGPMGVEDLTTYKYVVQGNGQIRT